MYGLNKTEAHGLDRFLNLLRNRSDYTQRTKGLLTGTTSTDALLEASQLTNYTSQYPIMSVSWTTL